MKRLALLAYLLILAVVYSLALATMLASAARGSLVLNEVLYDPDGADEGREFVELWNPDSVAAPLQDLTLEACDGARPGSWSVVWRGDAVAFVLPRSPYLIPAAALAAALQNGPDALRLARGGALLDLLGYGDLEDGSLHEGAPAVDAASGQSLARAGDGVDTGENRADWAPVPEPTPGEANHPELKLRFTRAVAVASPEVAWPGEAAEARVWVRNSGTRAVDAARWSVVAAMSDAEGAARDDVTAPGSPVAPGESVLVRVPLAVTAPGLWTATARLAGAPPGPEVADTAAAVIRCVAGPAVVCEFAFRDAGAGEWVEVWFRDAIDDLALVSLADDGSAPRGVDRGPVPRAIAAGATIVIAQDPAAVRARFVLPESLVVGVQGGWPSLNDGSSAGSTHADRVRVLVNALPSDAVPYAGERSARGGSVERLSVGLSSASPGTWSETIDPAGGTPGRANSVRAPERGEARGRGLLVASARVIHARGGAGAGESPAVFRVTEEALGRRLTVRVHDLLGRPLRTLVEGQTFRTDAAFVWDGKDERGETVAPGLYVVRAEALPDDTGAARSSSVLLAVAAGAPR